MIREGALPAGDCCAVTAMPTKDVMLFDVHCEQSYVTGTASRRWGSALMILGFFVCLPVGIFMWLVGYDLFNTQVQRVGHDIVVTVPVRVGADSQAGVLRLSQSRLRLILGTVPIYEQLLSDYPKAQIYPRSPAR
jgi:hypothetical protein